VVAPAAVGASLVERRDTTAVTVLTREVPPEISAAGVDASTVGTKGTTRATAQSLGKSSQDHQERDSLQDLLGAASIVARVDTTLGTAHSHGKGTKDQTKARDNRAALHPPPTRGVSNAASRATTLATVPVRAAAQAGPRLVPATGNVKL
jgi:hypothetical protein